jgi:hypothetical protein
MGAGVAAGPHDLRFGCLAPKGSAVFPGGAFPPKPKPWTGALFRLSFEVSFAGSPGSGRGLLSPGRFRRVPSRIAPFRFPLGPMLSSFDGSNFPVRVPLPSAFRPHEAFPCRTPRSETSPRPFAVPSSPKAFWFRRTLEGKWVRLSTLSRRLPRASSFRSPGPHLHLPRSLRTSAPSGGASTSDPRLPFPVGAARCRQMESVTPARVAPAQYRAWCLWITGISGTSRVRGPALRN